MAALAKLAHLGTSATVIGAAVGYFFVVDTPTRSETQQIRSEIQEKQQYIQTADRLVPQIEKSERESKEALAHVEEWHRSTPKADEVSSLYSRIHSAVRSEGAVVTKFEPQPSMPLASLQQVPLALTFMGNQQQVAKALTEIERLAETIWVRDVRLSQAGEDKTKVQCEVKLVVFADPVENSR